MKFRMIDGALYKGRTYRKVVAMMAQDKLRIPRNLLAYRKNTAQRVHEAYDLTIDPSSDKNFIVSLCKAGLMEQV